jgi:hypothetical protein
MDLAFAAEQYAQAQAVAAVAAQYYANAANAAAMNAAALNAVAEQQGQQVTIRDLCYDWKTAQVGRTDFGCSCNL